ncbi:hypothetical protein B0H14DRAFT_3163887 [Mycena olivaceomarginata]|nr:hypothetical protein B0H14DRAFT_3163887 [Mycena olivaceomarginata]
MADSDGFAWTPALVNLSNQLWAITAMIGAALCGAVLIVIGIVALNPVCRPHLDRYRLRYHERNWRQVHGPTWTCGLDIWLLGLAPLRDNHELNTHPLAVLTLELSSFLLFSIALNLQLVIVHQINGKKMQRWYILGSIVVSLALTVPPYAFKAIWVGPKIFAARLLNPSPRWDPLVQDCWYSNDNPKQRLAWQIGTQLFWSLLLSPGRSSALLLLSYIWSGTRSDPLGRKISEILRYLAASEEQHHVWQWLSDWDWQRDALSSGSVVATANNQVNHANTYRGIIFRIMLSVSSMPRRMMVHDWTGYRVLLLSDFVYGGRSIMYALLAATDPALVRAVRAFIQHSRGLYPSSVSGAHSTLRGTESKGNLSVHIELTTVHQNDSGLVMDRDGVPTKHAASPGTPHGYTDHFHSMLKPLTDIEEAPHGTELRGVHGSPGDLDERSRIRVQEDKVRRQRELAQLNQERQEFQRRI